MRKKESKGRAHFIKNDAEMRVGCVIIEQKLNEKGGSIRLDKDSDRTSTRYLVSASIGRLESCFKHISDEKIFNKEIEAIDRNPILSPYKGFMVFKTFNN